LIGRETGRKKRVFIVRYHHRAFEGAALARLAPRSAGGYDRAMSRRSIAWSFLSLALIGAMADARAQVTSAIDPAQIRVITPTESTSECIGDPRTPLCALETLLACIARKELPFCHRVGIFDYTPPEPAATYRYRVLSMKILTEADMRPDLAEADWWKPGHADIAVEHLDDRGVVDHGTSYILTPTIRGWEVMGWAVWGAENVDTPDDPDDAK
jgi:hypothetical protein